MGRYSFPDPNQPIQPTKPYTAQLSQSAAVVGTYYTVMDITSGMGILNRLSMFAGGGVANNAHYFRVTVDGTAYVLNNSQTTQARAFINETMRSDIVLPIYFKSSLKVETMLSTSQLMVVVADYALV